MHMHARGLGPRAAWTGADPARGRDHCSGHEVDHALFLAASGLAAIILRSCFTRSWAQ